MRRAYAIVSVPADEENVNASSMREGVHVPVNIPSPAARSEAMPLSYNCMTSSPFKVVAVTGPTADSQLILRAERVAETPAAIEDGYFNAEKTGRLPQVNEP